jgi:hypothetical protein
VPSLSDAVADWRGQVDGSACPRYTLHSGTNNDTECVAPKNLQVALHKNNFFREVAYYQSTTQP